MGFGFHKTNTIRLLDGVNFNNKKVVAGTAHGKDDLDLKEIYEFTKGKLSSGHLHNVMAVAFANKYLKGWI